MTKMKSERRAGESPRGKKKEKQKFGLNKKHSLKSFKAKPALKVKDRKQKEVRDNADLISHKNKKPKMKGFKKKETFSPASAGKFEAGNNVYKKKKIMGSKHVPESAEKFEGGNNAYKKKKFIGSKHAAVSAEKFEGGNNTYKKKKFIGSKHAAVSAEKFEGGNNAYKKKKFVGSKHAPASAEKFKEGNNAYKNKNVIGSKHAADKTAAWVSKKHMKQKYEGGDKIPTKKGKHDMSTLTKKERRLLRRKQKNREVFERGQKLKTLWEELRQEKCEAERKTQLLNECCRLIKDHAKELTFAHDTVRVVECVFTLGSKLQQSMLFEELKDSIIPLAKSKYGKFILIKILRNGSKDQANCITKEFHSRALNLMCHTEAAAVVEVIFNECANAAQRSELVQEFYGPSYRFFKESNCNSLGQLLKADASKTCAIINHMKEALSRILQKAVVKHSIVHFILREFMIHADPQSRSEVIELARPVLVEMLHSKDGSRAVMQCLWHGTSKDRKAIIKSFKSHVAKVAMEEHGHMVLLALFDCVDDTKLVERHIISELINNILPISENLYGRKVLLYLISPRDSVHFHPDVVKILEQGDGNLNSKKDAQLRRNELKKCVVEPVVKQLADHIHDHYTDNSYCLFTLSVLKHSAGYALEAFKSIAKLMCIMYSNEVKNTHIIESSGSNFMLLKLIVEDKNGVERTNPCFTEIVAEEASEEVLQSWTLCNRGCFLLVNILETGIQQAVEKIKESLCKYEKQLSKRTFVGANVLRKKLWK